MVFVFIWSLLLFFHWDIYFSNFFMSISRKLQHLKEHSHLLWAATWKGLIILCPLTMMSIASQPTIYTTPPVFLDISWILNKTDAFLLYHQLYRYYISFNSSLKYIKSSNNSTWHHFTTQGYRDWKTEMLGKHKTFYSSNLISSFSIYHHSKLQIYLLSE